MSKARFIVAGVLCSVGFTIATLEGCGGSSASYVSVCNQVCDKIATCAGVSTGTANCKQSCASETCTNESARISTGQACLAKDCAGLIPCLATGPACQGGGTAGHTGSAGSNGSAGASGSGGSSGTATCAICDKAASCCLAVGESVATCNAFSASSCNATAAANQATVISVCQQTLTAAAPLSLAACM